MSGESPARKFTRSLRGVTFAALILAATLVLAGVACGGGDSASDPQGASETTSEPETIAQEEALTPAEATVGPNEEANMAPAPGIGGDPPQPPPEDPPEGVETFPATTNRSVDTPVDYEREPPTNGDHSPIWQNCGFYAEPINNENAVHSLDHGAVWITYRPDLPAEQIEVLRQYAREQYVLVSPYPGQPAPVIATAWRNQLMLEDANDPRLRQFVNQFRLSETAPLAGNGCVGGVGEPVT